MHIVLQPTFRKALNIIECYSLMSHLQIKKLLKN